MADEQLKQQVDQYVEGVWEDVVEDIRSLVKIESVEDLEAAVKEAAVRAESGDVVIMSPASASFDRFKNFMERGKLFKALVEEL